MILSHSSLNSQGDVETGVLSPSALRLCLQQLRLIFLCLGTLIVLWLADL